jgi:oxaloacetate decarboxylase gamma subunit
MHELYDGLILMLIGMSTVFLFLSLLVIFIHFSSQVLNRFWPEELEISPQHQSEEDESLVAVISAAVHQYRKKHSSPRKDL